MINGLSSDLIQLASQQLHSAQRVLVVSHIRPDGDSIGSLLGLGLTLQEAGKAVQMVSVDGVPASCRHLPGSDQILYQSQGEFDTICVVDCSDLKRTGEALSGYGEPDLNIDHHVTNLNFARINLVAPTAVATAEILGNLLPAMGYTISQPVAAALLNGLITDTLGFRTSNMTPQALRLAADLMEKGGNLPELYRRALVTRSFEATRYWAAGLNSIQRDGKLVWTSLSLKDRQAAGYPGRDDADLVNILSSIDDAEIAIIFVEQSNGHVKVSWRAKPGVDVSQVALQFGGGGHPSASGADITGDLVAVQAAVLQATRAILNGNNNK